MMRCLQCKMGAMKDLVLERNGKPLKVEFCCYNCYKQFWGDNEGFIPLPQYVQK